VTVDFWTRIRKDSFEKWYEIIYEPGTLEAISYTGGMETGRHILHTASSVITLDAEVDAAQFRANGSDLAFIRVWLKDAEGNINMQAKEQIRVDVAGAGVLQGSFVLQRRAFLVG
jgi:beta-galactosidase